MPSNAKHQQKKRNEPDRAYRVLFQWTPEPDRMERMNVGLAMWDFKRKYKYADFYVDVHRAEKFFTSQIANDRDMLRGLANELHRLETDIQADAIANAVGIRKFIDSMDDLPYAMGMISVTQPVREVYGCFVKSFEENFDKLVLHGRRYEYLD